MIATEVELEDDYDESDEVEVEGLITDFESETVFNVFGIAVTTTSSTEYEDGTVSDLAENVRVEVEGTINDSGVLVADEIEFRSVEDTRVEAVVDSVGENQLVMLGITVVVTNLTQLEDDSDLDVRFFSLDDLSVGDFVEVRGKWKLMEASLRPVLNAMIWKTRQVSGA